MAGFPFLIFEARITKSNKLQNHHQKGVVVEIRKAYLAMIRAFSGGWDAIAPALGMTRDALENRIYERKGQSLLVETALQMQAFSGTKHFAEAVAVISGGTFVALPQIGAIDNDCIQSRFNETYAELGLLFSTFAGAVQDGEIDARERAQLESLGEDLHRKTEQLLGLMFKVYCKQSKSVMLAPKREADHG